jgi:predicted  nucleic acid-binding Zn-ribbon protein
MEQDYEEKMKELKDSFEFEKKRKADLEKELTNVKQELENIEIKFP